MPNDQPNNKDQAKSEALSGLLTHYLQTMEALRELLVSVGPKIEELDAKRGKFEWFTKTARSMQRDEALRFREILTKHTRRFARQAEQTRKRMAGADGQAEGVLSVRELIVPLSEQILEEFGDRKWATDFVSELVRDITKPWRLPIFNRSIVISLVSAFEVLIGDLVREFFSLRPGALEAWDPSEKEFSLADLESAGSIDAAIELAVARRVEDFLWLGCQAGKNGSIGNSRLTFHP